MCENYVQMCTNSFMCTKPDCNMLIVYRPKCARSTRNPLAENTLPLVIQNRISLKPLTSPFGLATKSRHQHNTRSNMLGCWWRIKWWWCSDGDALMPSQPEWTPSNQSICGWHTHQKDARCDVNLTILRAVRDTKYTQTQFWVLPSVLPYTRWQSFASRLIYMM